MHIIIANNKIYNMTIARFVSFPEPLAHYEAGHTYI